MASCFKTAVEAGFTWIQVTPHLDDGDFEKNVWRNEIIANPFEQYGGFSYVQVRSSWLCDAALVAFAGVVVSTCACAAIRNVCLLCWRGCIQGYNDVACAHLWCMRAQLCACLHCHSHAVNLLKPQVQVKLATEVVSCIVCLHCILD
jgi:hypothetical protein